MPHSASFRRILHRMGFYNYQQGLIFRHLNQQDRWDSHTMKCRNFIMRSIDIVRPSVITVLGSGWLMELPLAEMSGKAEKIRLIDILHPPEVIEQTARLANVEIIEEDLSGGLILEVWNKAGGRHFFNRLASLEPVFIPEYNSPDDPGLVISLNLLTQLEVLPVRLLKKKSKATEVEFSAFRKKVQENHLQFLKKHPSILISDSAEIITGRKGDLWENNTILADLPEGQLAEEWIWDFDLLHADYNRHNSQFRVIARLF